MLLPTLVKKNFVNSIVCVAVHEHRALDYWHMFWDAKFRFVLVNYQANSRPISRTVSLLDGMVLDIAMEGEFQIHHCYEYECVLVVSFTC